MNDSTPSPRPPLDERGLPQDYPLNAELEVTPIQLQQMKESGESVRLIDCRLPWEHALTHIEGDELVPLPTVNDEAFADREAETTIVYCRSGKRSMEFLHKAEDLGATNIKSLAGGILAWNALTGNGPQY